NVEYRFISDTFKGVVQTILDELLNGIFRHEVKVALLVNPIDNFDFWFVRLFTRFDYRLFHILIEPLRLFFANNIDEFNSDHSLHLLFLSPSFDYVRTPAPHASV